MGGLAKLSEMNEDAVKVLAECLAAPSHDTRRKAAMDILTVNNVVGAKRVPVPEVTEEQLGIIGQILRETAGIPDALEGAERKVGVIALPSPR